MTKSSASQSPKKSVQFEESRNSVHSYPCAVVDFQDRENLYYTAFWLKFIRRNNDRDLEKISKGDTSVEQRGMEMLIDPNYRKAKDLRYQAVRLIAVEATSAEDLENDETAVAMAKACEKMTKPAQALAQERAKNDAAFVEEQRILDEQKREASLAPHWLWAACDCFHPMELDDHPTQPFFQPSLTSPMALTAH